MNASAELALGTAQFGMPYGISGRGSAVPPREIREILDCAQALGISVLDTAPAYGDIEERLCGYLGELAIAVVSKIPALPEQATPAAAAAFVRDSVRRTRGRLGSRLRTILFHRGQDLLEAHGDAAWAAVGDELRGTGVRIGASCYSPAEAIAIQRRFPVAVAQIPGNALDQRLLANGAGRGLEGVEIHLRSIFLQGLLLMPRDLAVARVPRAAGPLAAWAAWRSERGIDALHGALGAAKSLPGVRYCVVGVDRKSQLEEIAQAWRDTAALSVPLATTDPDVIDPRRWVGTT